MGRFSRPPDVMLLGAEMGDGVETQPVRNLQEVIRRLEAEDDQRRGPSVLAKLAAHITPPGRSLLLERRIVQAAETDRWTLGRLFEFKLFGLLLGFVTGSVVIFVLGVSSATVAIAVGTTFVGFIGLDLVLSERAEHRQREIQRALPDMLDQMVISVEAGLGLESALTRVARTTDNPLADELTRTLRDMRLGASRGEALRALLDRVDVPDLRLFVRALIQADRSGVAVASVCRVQAEEARVRRRQRAEERAMRMPVKLVFPLVTCILPSLFIVVLGPAVLRLGVAGIL
jgi:tight adherence protein C